MIATGFVLFILSFAGINIFSKKPYTNIDLAMVVCFLIGCLLMLIGFAIFLWRVFP